MANDLISQFNKLANIANNDDLFNSFGRTFFNNWNNGTKPLKSDIEETSDAYIVKIDIPGVDKKDISLNFKDDVLTVDAKREVSTAQKNDKGTVLASEIDYGQYSRSYRFPKVDSKDISAKYDKGVLTITLPKSKSEIDNNHNIQIN